MTDNVHSATAIEAVELYRLMLRIRRFEEKVLKLRLDNEIIGSVHLCNGVEAVAAGVGAAREKEDPVFATYRGHGWALATGAPLREMFAELLGRSTGVNGGRGGSAHLSVPGTRFMGENSIVGGGVPIAAGAALASQIDASGVVAISVFGDGAMNQGSVHETMNLAGARHLPIIFVCENNIYSELTPISDMVGMSELYRRAEAYGFGGLRVDGNDPEEVRDVARVALAKARSGAGPTLIEAMTERLVGHYIGDQQQYRPPGEVEDATSREPLVRMRSRLADLDVSEAEIVAIDRAVEASVEQAAALALADPLSETESLLEHLYEH